MAQGSAQAEVRAKAEVIAGLLGARCRARDILFSSRIPKKSGLRI